MRLTVRRFEITTRDGLILRGEAFGDRNSKATPVVCLPGLTRSSRDFHMLAERLSQDETNPRFVMTLNSRGRGPSDYDTNPQNYNVLTEAKDTIDTLVAAGISKASFIGTSRGGLLTLAIAVMKPTLIAGTVLNDIGPEIDATGIARIKTYMTRTAPVKTWEDAVSFVKTANAHTFTDLSEGDWSRLAQMTFRDEGGAPANDFDIQIIKGLEGIDLSDTAINLWPHFLALSHRPLLVVRGENSDILPKAVAQRMIERHPDSQLLEVKGQGHAPLLIFDEINEQIASCLQEVDNKYSASVPRAAPAWLSDEETIFLDHA
nr:alpha/beta hydrolase [uncultured Cohaesibacter sp.]